MFFYPLYTLKCVFYFFLILFFMEKKNVIFILCIKKFFLYEFFKNGVENINFYPPTSNLFLNNQWFILIIFLDKMEKNKNNSP